MAAPMTSSMRKQRRRDGRCAAIAGLVLVSAHSSRCLALAMPVPNAVPLSIMGPGFPGAPFALGAFSAGMSAPAPAPAPATPPPISRAEVCMTCYRLCPVNCFVGQCGMDYPLGVYRYKDTPKCYSCDASTAASIRGADLNSFTMCSTEEAKAPVPLTQATESQTEEIEEANMHQVATSVRMSEAEQIKQAAVMAYKSAVEQYNSNLRVLRADELKADEAKKVVARSMAIMNTANKRFQLASNENAKATARLAVLSGAGAGGDGSDGLGVETGSRKKERDALKAESESMTIAKLRTAQGMSPCETLVPGAGAPPPIGPGGMPMRLLAKGRSSVASAAAPAEAQKQQQQQQQQQQQAPPPQQQPPRLAQGAAVTDPALATALASAGLASALQPNPVAGPDPAAGLGLAAEPIGAPNVEETEDPAAVAAQWALPQAPDATAFGAMGGMLPPSAADDVAGADATQAWASQQGGVFAGAPPMLPAGGQEASGAGGAAFLPPLAALQTPPLRGVASASHAP